MTDRPVHFFDTITDEDWQMVATALHKLDTPRSRQLSQDFLAWRIQVSSSRTDFLKALRELRQ